jgi:DNA-binding XRE family transcriptional regulator
MYLDGKKIKRIMWDLKLNHNELSVFCGVSSGTIYNIITKDVYNTSAIIGLKIYKYFKLQNKVSSPAEILNLDFIEKEVTNGF